MPSFLALLLLAALPTYRLVDSVGEPVRDATIRVAGGSTVARTNERGQFRLDPAPAPPFELAVFSRRARSSGTCGSPTRARPFSSSR